MLHDLAAEVGEKARELISRIEQERAAAQELVDQQEAQPIPIVPPPPTDPGTQYEIPVFKSGSGQF